MKEYDKVELIVEKDYYGQDGVHKGMTGWICDPRKIDGYWLVCFDMDEYFKRYPIIGVKDEYLKFLYNKETLLK